MLSRKDIKLSLTSDIDTQREKLHLDSGIRESLAKELELGWSFDVGNF